MDALKQQDLRSALERVRDGRKGARETYNKFLEVESVERKHWEKAGFISLIAIALSVLALFASTTITKALHIDPSWGLWIFAVLCAGGVLGVACSTIYVNILLYRTQQRFAEKYPLENELLHGGAVAKPQG